jgi:hypothetical protein
LQTTQMKSIPLRRRILLRAGLLTLLAVGGLCKVWSQDSASSQSAKPATQAKVILEVTRRSFTIWGGKWGHVWSQPQVVLRVFFDRSAETDTKKTTLTPEQFKKVRSFLDRPDLLALKSSECGSAGADQIAASKITLHHSDREQVI